MFIVFGGKHGNLERRGYLLGEPFYYKDLFRVECFGEEKQACVTMKGWFSQLLD